MKKKTKPVTPTRPPLGAAVRVVLALLHAPAVSRDRVLDAVAALAAVDCCRTVVSALLFFLVGIRCNRPLLTPGVQHAARVPEEGSGGVVEVVAPARDRGGVEQDVLVSLAESRVRLSYIFWETGENGESWAAGSMLTSLPETGTGSAWARRPAQTAPGPRRRGRGFGSSLWIWVVVGGDGGVSCCSCCCSYS